MAKKWKLSSFINLPDNEKRITISTLFTLLRIVLVPFIVGSMRAGLWGYAFALFLVAALSDVVDGNLARWWNDHTFLGACLDPLADKLLVVSCFCAFVFIEPPFFHIPHWFVLFVLFKEIVVLSGVIIIYWVKGGVLIKPTLLGKGAALLQMSFITWLLAACFFQWVSIPWYFGILVFTQCVMCLALCQYVCIGWHQLWDNDERCAREK